MEQIGALSLKLKTNLSKRDCLKLKAYKKVTVEQVNSKADYLARKFSRSNGDRYIPFFRKVAWHLPEAQIDDILRRSPSMYYFIGVCKKELAKLGGNRSRC